eukprot:tig00001181_g7443.t1
MVGSLYIARHGERVDYINAVWNDDADFPYDPPLSDDGMRHAQELGRRLARRVHRAGPGGQIHKVLVSPFWRTLQTASGANAWLNAPMEIYPMVCEHISGRYFHELPLIEMNSLPGSILAKNFPGLQAPKGPVQVAPYPESKEQMSERAANAVRMIAQQYCMKQNLNVLVVTHAAVAQEMMKGLVGLEEYEAVVNREGAVGYCASVKLSFQPGLGRWGIEWYHRGEKTRHVLHWYSFVQDRVMELFTGPLKQRLKDEMRDEIESMQ